MSYLNNQTNKPIVLVTGANRGIGYEVCRLLAQEQQYNIILTSRKSDEGLTKANKLRKTSSNVTYLQLDVSDHESIIKFEKELSKHFSSIDILVNNAGIYLDSEDLDEFPSFFDVTTKILESTFNTNLFGSMYLVQLLLTFFSNKALVINVSSGNGKINTSGDRSGHIAYRTSKTGLNAFTKSISLELLKNNIKIVSMCPGWVQTEMGGPQAPKTITEGAMDIIELIKDRKSLKTGLFLYDLKEQVL